MWVSADAADAAQEAFDASPLGTEFLALLESNSISIERFEGVD